MRPEVNNLESSVVGQELELAINLALNVLVIPRHTIVAGIMVYPPVSVHPFVRTSFRITHPIVFIGSL